MHRTAPFLNNDSAPDGTIAAVERQCYDSQGLAFAVTQTCLICEDMELVCGVEPQAGVLASGAQARRASRACAFSVCRNQKLMFVASQE